MTIYLYKKTHSKTGFKYLGKTSRNPYNYSGSGIRWLRHIKKYGNEVVTEVLRECRTNEEVKEWGTYYSKLWNIVESEEWANLKEENGDGGFGRLPPESIRKSVETRRKNGTYINRETAKQKRINTLKARGGFFKQTKESIEKQLATKTKNGTTNKGRKHTQEELEKMKLSHLGSKNGSAKLTENDVRFIRSSSLTLKELALVFGVSLSTISNVRSGRYWSHVSD